MTDGRGSFYYLTSDLLNPNFHEYSKRSSMAQGGNCVPVGSFNEQLGPSMNNNFILVHISEDQHDEEPETNAITIDDLRQSLQVPERNKNYVYSVQAGTTTKYTGLQTGYPRTKTHYLKPGSTAELLVLVFGAKGIPETLLSGDAGLWVHIQDPAQPKFKTPLPRPGQPGCKLVGHVASTSYDDTGEVLVQPLTKTIEGLVACLENIGEVSGRKA